MKAILFDVDGVFLSEERCFDVSAITVAELLSLVSSPLCWQEIIITIKLMKNIFLKIE